MGIAWKCCCFSTMSTCDVYRATVRIHMPNKMSPPVLTSDKAYRPLHCLPWLRKRAEIHASAQGHAPDMLCENKGSVERYTDGSEHH